MFWAQSLKRGEELCGTYKKITRARGPTIATMVATIYYQLSTSNSTGELKSQISAAYIQKSKIKIKGPEEAAGNLNSLLALEGGEMCSGGRACSFSRVIQVLGVGRHYDGRAAILNRCLGNRANVPKAAKEVRSCFRNGCSAPCLRPSR